MSNKIFACLLKVYFKERNERLYTFTILKLRSYCTKFTKFTQRTQIIADELLKNRNVDIPSLSGMPRRRMKMSRPISPILTLKLIAMATSIERSKKDGQIDNQRSNTYNMVKTW